MKRTALMIKSLLFMDTFLFIKVFINDFKHDFWENNCTLVNAMIPGFLEMQHLIDMICDMTSELFLKLHLLFCDSEFL